MFPSTLKAQREKIEASDALYVPCPRCNGSRLVFAYTVPPTEFTPGRGEYFTCPLCSGTAEPPREEALRWIDEQLLDEED